MLAGLTAGEMAGMGTFRRNNVRWISIATVARKERPHGFIARVCFWPLGHFSGDLTVFCEKLCAKAKQPRSICCLYNQELFIKKCSRHEHRSADRVRLLTRGFSIGVYLFYSIKIFCTDLS